MPPPVILREHANKRELTVKKTKKNPNKTINDVTWCKYFTTRCWFFLVSTPNIPHWPHAPRENQVPAQHRQITQGLFQKGTSSIPRELSACRKFSSLSHWGIHYQRIIRICKKGYSGCFPWAREDRSAAMEWGSIVEMMGSQSGRGQMLACNLWSMVGTTAIISQRGL